MKRGIVMPFASLLIKNPIIYLENGESTTGSLFIQDGKISSIEPDVFTTTVDPSTTIIDGNGLHLIPGFIDTHIHGANGADTMDASGNALDTIAAYIPKEGTTSFLATTMTQPTENIENALRQFSSYENKPGQAEILGVHLEGPFVEKSKAGAQPLVSIKKPNLNLFKSWQQLSGNNIRIITMAPEHDPSGKFISALKKQGVVVSAGHTNAAFAEIKQATTQGVTQLTHLCNAMNGIHHRDIGAVGAAFLLKELKAELIADEIHVVPEMLELIYENMGSERIILITDGMRAKGLQDGEYDLGGQSVTVAGGKATLADGTLAGSVLSMRDAAVNMMKVAGVTIHDIIKMTAENSAKQIGVYDRKGSITIGKDADLLLVDKKFNIKHTICKGHLY